MTKVFIVDDEEIIREGLRDLIPWSSLNSEVIGMAKNGQEAFEKIKELKPDIVFTDIKMPKMDGLQLSEKLSVIMPNIKIIILTGYDDFEYARHAIHLSVKDYILKPIDKEKLIECVKNVRETIEKENRVKLKEESIRKQITEGLPYMKAWFLNLIDQNKDEGLWSKLEFLGINLDKGYFQAVNILIENIEGKNENEKPYLIFSVFEGIKNLLSSIDIKLLIFIENENINIIFSYPKDLIKNQAINKSFEVLNMIKDYLNYNYRCNYTIGLGSLENNIFNISNSYMGAVNACKYKFYIGDNKIIYIEDVEPIKEKRKYELALDDNFEMLIKVGNRLQINSMIRKLFVNMKEDRENISTVKMVCYELMVQALRAANEVGEKIDEIIDEKDPWFQINNKTTIEQLHIYITDVIDTILNYLLGERESKNKKLIEVVKRNIKENYHNNISLESVANEIHLSPCYLSTLFSQEVGTTFKDYLIQTRIKKAKALLADLNIKIYEVAEKVGYSDSHYFSQIFKKYTGVTPVHYRNTQIFSVRAD